MKQNVIALSLVLGCAMIVATGVRVGAQRGQGRGGPPPTPRAAAPVDLTGYWVSVVTEDWRFRMVTPPKGDYASVPLNAEARRVADAWDPSKDGVCDAYGAAAIMRMPGRLHITWDDDNTLKIETDAGQQTRLLRFGVRPASGPGRRVAAEGSRRRSDWAASVDWRNVAAPDAAAPAAGEAHRRPLPDVGPAPRRDAGPHQRDGRR